MTTSLKCLNSNCNFCKSLKGIASSFLKPIPDITFATLETKLSLTSSFGSGILNVPSPVNVCTTTLSVGLSFVLIVSTSYLTSSGSNPSFCFSIFSARVFSNWSSLSKKPLRAFSLVESRFAMITCSLFASDTVPKN